MIKALWQKFRYDLGEAKVYAMFVIVVLVIPPALGMLMYSLAWTIYFFESLPWPCIELGTRKECQ